MKNTILMLSILALTGAGLMAQGVTTAPLPTVLNDAIPGQVVTIDKNGAGSQAEVKGLRVRLPGPAGTLDLDVVMMRELSTGLFWWRFFDVLDQPLEESLLDFHEAHAVAATDSKIAVFTFVMPELRVRESAQRYSSMAAGREAVLEALRRDQQLIEENRFVQFVRIPVAAHLREELLLPAGGFPSETLSVSQARKNAGGWTVTLRGLESVTETLTLGEAFGVLRVGTAPGDQPIPVVRDFN